MKHHPSWLAAGLILFVLLACNLGKKSNTNDTTNRNGNSNSESTDTGSGEFIKEIHMAKDKNGSPGDETSSFSSDEHTVHCVVKLKEAKAGTQMKFSWWIVEADGTKNQKIKDIDYSTKPLENIVHGHLTLPQNWPAGKYKVQVYVNGDLDKTLAYTIE